MSIVSAAMAIFRCFIYLCSIMNSGRGGGGDGKEGLDLHGFVMMVL